MTKKNISNKNDIDSKYFLKIVLFFILGCLWIGVGGSGISIPVGLILGIIFARHDHFSIDRKIEYAILLMASVLSYVAPIGFVLKIG